MKKYLAEFMGTLVLVLIGCGTAASIGCDVTGGYLATALAFGLAIVAMAYSIGNISGCHVNPAVSVAVYLNGGLNEKDLAGYIVSQILGAFAGAGILMLILGKESGLGANALYNNNVGMSFLIEALLTFVFVLAILGVTSKESYSSVAGLVIGLSLTLVHLIGIGLTGTSVNPARSLGPAILSGNTTGLWVFLVAPIAGAMLAAFFYKYLSRTTKHA